MKLFSRNKNSSLKANASALYIKIARQARQPLFHTELEVPDTLDGRFDLAVLHVFLVLRRLKDEGEKAEGFAQALFDTMFLKMDDSLRQMGVGDLSVGKRIKKMTSAFYDRVDAYDGPLVSGDKSALAEALARNLYRGEEIPDGIAERVADYVIKTYLELKSQPFERFRLGLVDFSPIEPQPATDPISNQDLS